MKPHILLLCGALLALRGAARAQSAPAIAAPEPPPNMSLETPPGLEFKLSSPVGKTSFRIGETIELQLSFSNKGESKFYLDQFYREPLTLKPLALFEVEPKTGTRDPLGGVPAPTSLAIMGNIPAPLLLSAQPTVNRFALNQYVRFEAPGTYTIRAKTARVFASDDAGKPPRGSVFVASPNAKFIVSQPLTIEITPADAAWQAEQIAAWRALWGAQKRADYGWTTPPGTAMPAGDLRFFDTRAAALAMIERLGQDDYARSSGSEAYFWRSGLLGFSDRLWLIGAMKAAIERPDYAVTQGFLGTLAELQSLYHLAPVNGRAPRPAFGAGVERATAQNWDLAYRALAAKSGRARLVSLYALMETAWNGDTALAQTPAVRAGLPRLQAQVPQVFADLPPIAQQYLLDDRFNADAWARVKSPRFAPVLKRAWDELPPPNGSYYRPFADAVLHRFYETDPINGRAAIAREMAAANPRATFAALAQLPDKTLPALQEIWWRHLNQNGADQDTAALLIGRYADETLRARVKKEFDQRLSGKLLSSDVAKGLRQYLGRVG